MTPGSSSRFLVYGLIRVIAAVLLCMGILLPGGRPAQAVVNIQALIDLAPNGAIINIPADTYYENLTINKNLTLAGDPNGGTTLQPPAGKPGITLGVDTLAKTSAAVVTIKDLAITGGSILSGSGGAIYGSTTTALVIQNCTISNNSAIYGGGVYLENGSLTISGSTISDNHANENGGGIYSKVMMTLTNTTVQRNSAGRFGGGAFGNSGLVTLISGAFEYNTAGSNGGGLDMNDDLTITGTSFTNNTSGGDGGGVLQWNNKVNNIPVNVTLINPYFADNAATGKGGGVTQAAGGGMMAKGNTTVAGGTFLRNTAGDLTSNLNAWGGGLYVEAGALSLEGTTFEANKAVCTGCPQSGGGGLAIANAVSNQVARAAFIGNKGWFGGGLYQGKSQTDTSYGSLTVLRSTFLNNTGGYGGGVDGINATVRDSLFDGNFAENAGGGLDLGGTSLVERVRVLRNKTAAQSGMGAGMYLAGTPTVRNTAVVDNSNAGSMAVGSGIKVDKYTNTLTLEQVTISHNTGGNGAGLEVDGGAVAKGYNLIIANQAAGVCVTAGSATLDGVLWYNNQYKEKDAPGCGVSASASHSVEGNPAFAADGYHITSGSAAFNTGQTFPTGAVADDIDGDTRPQFGLYDLGADELVYHLFLPSVSRSIK